MTERLEHRCQLASTTHETRQGDGQLAGELFKRTQRRELPPQPGMADLKDHLRATDVTQLIRPKLCQHGTVWKCVAHKLLGDQRHDDLATVRRAHQASCAVHRRAEIVTVTQFSGTGMDPHPNPQWLGHRPWLIEQRQLGIDRGRNRGVRRRERGMDPITRSLDELTTIRRHRLPQNDVVASQRAPHDLRFPLPQPCRQLKISEQKRHRPRRQFDHVAQYRILVPGASAFGTP